MRAIQGLLLLAFALGLCQAVTKWNDRILHLPGLTFSPGFEQYSGFLPTSSGNKLHYWLVESQRDPQNDPLILWLNGGPGCSSLGGLFTELGPFRVNPDGKTLFENIYSWNKAANVIFLEAPHGVGYSYSGEPADPEYNDQKTAADNADAMKAFFERFPEYYNRPFFISGESYGGIYIPTLSNEINKRIINNQMPNVNFRGFAVGNGLLNYWDQINSVISLLYYRGIYGKEEFDSLQKCCKPTGAAVKPLGYCDFSQYIHIDAAGGVVVARNYTNQTEQECAMLVQEMAYDRVWDTINNVYNTYQDCYMDSSSLASMRAMRQSHFKKRRRQKSIISDGKYPFIDQGSKVNMGSTDAQGGFPCWMDAATENYLNLPEVRAALHIPDTLPRWTDCSWFVSEHYTWQYYDTAPVFDEMFNSGRSLRILIYSGDTDTVCNFLGNEWFIKNLSTKHQLIRDARTQWNFTDSQQFTPALAGYHQLHRSANGRIVLDFVTVKGAGHFVPLDRAGPALQMIHNFINNKPYSTITNLGFTKRPLLLPYQPTSAPKWTRKDADRVWNLPGVTYELNFKQYSGYLNPSKGNYLHYWLTESQSSPSTDPLVLWLNGGPGCSSLIGLLTELGPFWPNPDGRTLMENIYSWNRVANVLFVESPRMVGYSYQNMTENSDTSFSDEKTAQDNFLAIMDFLSAYPEYNNRPFYVTGESYAGVYIPTLVSLMIDMIQTGKAPGLNLVGVAIGNGKMTDKYQLNSAITLLYNHGIYGTDIMDALSTCCPKSEPLRDCDFSQWVGFDQHGDAHPINSSQCGSLVAEYGRDALWASGDIQDPYNMLQDCYLEKATATAGTKQNLKQFIQRRAASGFLDQKTKMNFASTDSQGAFQCYSSVGAENWLNWDDVRAALHIVPEAGRYSDCNGQVSSNYTKQNGDTSPVFDRIVRSGYKLRMLIYNGDLDTVCNFVGDEWFTEALVSRMSMTETIKREPWKYMSQIAGYYKRFQYQSTFTVDVLTVKGAGHMVPTDRPGPGLQMIRNFLLDIPYSTKLPFGIVHTPLKAEYETLLKISASLPLTRSRISHLFSEPSQLHVDKKSQRPAYSVGDPPAGSKETDRIEALPGVTFSITFKQYSGYLQASKGNFLHYWFVESQGNSTRDPLILWLNGGPGCSSLGGLLTELGPFRPNPDGTTLYENQFAWNKVGNILFLESPRDVGFSYRSNSVPVDTLYNDDKTAEDNVLALKAFFERFPEYKNRDFYVSGESYGGVYTPTLTDLLIKRIQDGSMNYVNLKGLAIGNGILSGLQQINSAPQLLYYRGVLGKRELDRLKPCCTINGVYDNYCDLSQFITLDSAGNAHAKPSPDAVKNECGKLVEDMAFMKIWESGNDVYNTYQDCYVMEASNKKRQKRNAASMGGLPLTNVYPFINQASRINYMSTDALGTFPCYMDAATAKYLNLPEVQKAIHIQQGLPVWSDCNFELNSNYIQQHNDTTSVFQSIINSNYALRILVYNGDSDAACNFLGDEWFIEKVAKTNNMKWAQRHEWNYTSPGGYMPRIAGYVKTFTSSKLTIDLLTVKGGSHFVPTDRPAPALQMIANFVYNKPYSTIVTYDTNAKPLLPEYAPTTLPKPCISVSRMEADKIYDLPGLTFQINFNQYSGYLYSSTKGNYLHYWFMESQGNPARDPVVLWLNGGPGCSSLGGLLSELGPFRTNPDGRTLYENVYSWNKAANMLFLETPRGVGFSYQDTSVNNDTTWDDAETAQESAAALEDFFTVFEQFRDNEFYITGESYAGIYIPMLVDVLIRRIQSGQLKMNLVGAAIGNGAFSIIQEVRSNPDFLYFRGIYGKDEWDELYKCCISANGNPSNICEYERYVTIDGFGNVVGINSANATIKRCGQLVAQLAYDRVWNTANDAYNLYQDCYRMALTGSFIPEDRRIKSPEQIFNELQRTPRNIRAAYADVMASVNTISTDATGGFQCFMKKAVVEYLNQPHVRDAIHIPTYVPLYQKCSDMVGSHYTQLYNDSTPVFQSILNSNYKLRMLIYNGDVDSVCSILEAQWFFEDFAKKNSMSATKRAPWHYQLSNKYSRQIAGYQQFFSKGSLSIDLLTVKGAGHYVPTDRPGPTLQMFTNFIRNSLDYNLIVPFDLTRKPLLPQYQPPTPQPVETTVEPTTTTATTTTTKATTTTMTNPVTTQTVAETTTVFTTETTTTTTSEGLSLGTSLSLVVSLFAMLLFTERR